MLKSLCKSLWVIGCLSLVAFAGLSGGLRLINIEDVGMGMDMETAAGFGGVPGVDIASGDYLELDPMLMIARDGYEARSYVVKTEDGYLLTMHRIFPKGDGEHHPVLIQHGLVASSPDWLPLGPGKALPYLLADQGFDVWLGNIRGNTYSRAHMTLAPSQREFWNFTFHEHGFYDVPAMTEFMLKETGHKQLSYIGHSMGTTMFFIFCSTRPELQSRIRQMHALAPIAFMSNMKSPIKKAAPFARTLQVALPLMKQYECMQHGSPGGYLEMELARLTGIGAGSIETIMGAIVGPDPDQLNNTLLPGILGHYPAGASCQSILHYLQEMNTGKFQRYDEGTEKANMRRYGTPQPPEYDLSQVKVPIHLHYGLNDYLAAVVDVEKLYQKLTQGNNNVRLLAVPLKAFNHIDFQWANDAKTLLYDSIIKALNTASMKAQIEASHFPEHEWHKKSFEEKETAALNYAKLLKSAPNDVSTHQLHQHHGHLAEEWLYELERQNSKMVKSPDAFSDAHVEWFRMTMNKIKNFPDHLAAPVIERMLGTILENVFMNNEMEFEQTHRGN